MTRLVFLPACVTTDRETLIERAIAAGADRAVAEETIDKMADGETFLSECGTYQVIRRPTANGFGLEMVSLSIKRVDREPIHDWRILQEIKNALVGEECEAIEIFPAESRLVDTANQYWLWCFTDPEIRVPVGFTVRAVADTTIMEGTKQRPRT
jgi:hypothetical protein